MEIIKYKNEVIGFRLQKLGGKTVPVTHGSEPLQLVTLNHPKGTYLKAHYHTPRKRETAKLQECIIVKKGKIRLDLYNSNQKLFKKIFLSAGDLFLSMSGGIGIHMIKDSEVFEIKNGPFVEDKILIE